MLILYNTPDCDNGVKLLMALSVDGVVHV